MHSNEGAPLLDLTIDDIPSLVKTLNLGANQGVRTAVIVDNNLRDAAWATLSMIVNAGSVGMNPDDLRFIIARNDASQNQGEFRELKRSTLPDGQVIVAKIESSEVNTFLELTSTLTNGAFFMDYDLGGFAGKNVTGVDLVKVIRDANPNASINLASQDTWNPLTANGQALNSINPDNNFIVTQKKLGLEHSNQAKFLAEHTKGIKKIPVSTQEP